MALTDFWELKDNQVFDGKPVLNIYHLKRIDGGANAGAVAQAFLDWVVEELLQDVQPEGLTRTTVDVENLGSPTDFASIDSSEFSGGVAGQTMPGFNAATIQFNRTRTDMKNGMKRWVAGSEGEQDSGEWVPGFVTLLQAVADKIMLPWEEDTGPGVELVSFCILKRFCVVEDQDPCEVYRLPNTPTEIDDNHYVPTNALTRVRVRSQVSRKVLQ
jgi:hypothetical protein